MKHTFRLIFAVLAGISIAACTSDIDALQERVDDLDSRVTNLETSLGALNANIAALSVLAGGATINNVEEKDGVYTVTLTNGDKIVVNQGSIGVGLAPIMTIDSEGYWKADYQDGNGSQFIRDASGAKVSAKGADGKTPVFSIDKDGFWTVSYDGSVYVQVKDVNGEPVKAVGSGDSEDSYFKDVKVEDEVFTLTLRNGDVYRVPVVKDFLVSIKDVENIQVFNLSEEKSFTVEMKGVSQTILSAPAGWTASLSEALLTVKAPATLTRATIADLSTDVSILAISAQGYSAIAKVRVQIDGAASTGTPKASVTASTVGFDNIVFSVVAENCTGWNWMLRKSSDEAPGVAALLTTGTAGTGSVVTCTGLSEMTGYVLYVLPMNGDDFGSVATCTATTIAEPVVTYEDNYTAYNEGKAISICGVKYDKATWGDPILVTADAAETDLRQFIHDKTGVFFLEENDGCHFVSVKDSQTQITKDVVIISRYTSKPVTYTPGRYHNLRKNGTFAVKNVKIDLNNLTESYLLNFTTAADGGPLKNMHFDGCEFLTGTAKQLSYSAAHVLVNSIRFYNCYIESRKAGRMDFMALSTNPNLDNVKEVVYHNNIFYNPNTTGALALFGNNMAKPTSGSQETDFVLTQNTFYGMAGSNVLFQTYGARSLKVEKNIFYAPAGQTAHTFILKTGSEGDVVCILNDNIAFGSPNTDYTHSNSLFKISEGNRVPKAEEDLMSDADPEHKDFAPIAKYASYGAQR